MDNNLKRRRVVASVAPIRAIVRTATQIVVALTILFAATTWAADGRTVLKPGWNMFSPQQDIEVGQQVSPDAEKQLRMLNNSRVDTYVNNLGRRLSAKAPGEKYPYRFKVVDDQAINAFALPGGPIYLNRGVIEAADNESQLAGVIAHEISHVALRHGTNQASKASAAQVPLSILGGMLGSDSTGAALTQLGAGFAVNSVLLKYSRTAESQADIMGTQILFDSGYDSRAMAQFFSKIEAQQKGGGQVEFFSNHPSPENRIERVNQEASALGDVRHDVATSSRNFDDNKRYVRSLPAPPAKSQLQANTDRKPTVAGALRIVSASYGANRSFIDVLQRLQARVQDNRLDLLVNNSSMGGDPISESKTLQVKYQWNNRAYEVTVQENQRLSIPSEQQISDASGRSNGNTGGGSAADVPSDRFVAVENAVLRIDRPDNWQVHGQGDAITITPRGGLVDDGEGNQAMVYGVIVNIFEPRSDGYGQQLQGSAYGQGAARDAATRLEDSTAQLVEELRKSNQNMRVTGDREAIRVDGDRAMSTHLSNDSPTSGRETDWLVTMERPDGLLFIVFAAPERDFQRYDVTFQKMLRSVRIKR